MAKLWIVITKCGKAWRRATGDRLPPAAAVAGESPAAFECGSCAQLRGRDGRRGSLLRESVAEDRSAAGGPAVAERSPGGFRMPRGGRSEGKWEKFKGRDGHSLDEPDQQQFAQSSSGCRQPGHASLSRKECYDKQLPSPPFPSACSRHAHYAAAARETTSRPRPPSMTPPLPTELVFRRAPPRG